MARQNQERRKGERRLVTSSSQTGPSYAETAFVRVSPWAVSAAGAAVATATALALIEVLGDERENLLLAVCGYVIGSLVTPVLVIVHRGLVQVAERDLWFTPRPLLDRLATAALVAGLLVGTWHAFVLATELAKRGGT